MARYYLDYVGLNTFIYEPVGYDPPNQTVYLSSVLPSVKYFERVTIGNIPYININTIGMVDTSGNPSYPLSLYKNFNFPGNLVDPHTNAHPANAAGLLRATASFFPALMSHRNGPYGWPIWKQTRVGENPLTRRQKKANVFTFVREPGEEFNFKIGGAVNTLRSKYGNIEQYKEIPVTRNYRPIFVQLATKTGKRKFKSFTTKASYGNQVGGFNNPELNLYYGHDHKEHGHRFNKLKKTYLQGGIKGKGSPVDAFEYLTYSQIIFPQKLYEFTNYKRKRTTFTFNWRTDRSNRSTDVGDGDKEFYDGFDNWNYLPATVTFLTKSVWPMDVDNSDPWESKTEAILINGAGIGSGYGKVFGSGSNSGILMNTYASWHHVLFPYAAANYTPKILGAAPRYAHVHAHPYNYSVISPSGMPMEGITYGNLPAPNGVSPGYTLLKHLPGGQAKWEAASQSGLAPFYDSYDEYFEEMRGRFKNACIVPEFRISSHVRDYQLKGIKESKTDLFELTGGLSGVTGSSEDNFYTIFSNSDFLEHFEYVKQEHEGFAPPSRIRLRCNAVKKFLPYDGFYPVQRTVDIAKQFYKSYSGSVVTTSENISTGSHYETGFNFGYQNLYTPLFAPGVLFNAIKAGVAVDYPIFTGSWSKCVVSDDETDGTRYGFDRVNNGRSDRYFLNMIQDTTSTPPKANNFHKRIPFKALVEPDKYLAGYEIPCQDPHPSGNISASVMWDGQGDDLYKLMMHNFLAEVPDFYLAEGRFSRLYSKKSSDPSVGNAIKDTTYMMRVKMYKSTAAPGFADESSDGLALTSSTPQVSRLATYQYGSGSQETFTMYSRPSAFGPNSKFYMKKTQADGSGTYTQATWVHSGLGWYQTHTPPYYDGQAWADITFYADETKKYSINEIINRSTVRYWRYIHPASNCNGTNIQQTKLQMSEMYNTQLLQLSASVNLFGKSKATTADQIAGQAPAFLENDDQRWVIQTRFETPMLNFNHLSASSAVTLPVQASESVPRGMWHQYGKIEEDPSKGIFMQVTDVPDIHIENLYAGTGSFEPGSAAGMVLKATGSLMDLCQFRDKPKRLGRLRDSKKVWEAVVAIPFVEKEGVRSFFKLDPQEVKVAIAQSREEPTSPLFEAGYPREIPRSVEKMVNKMKRYVFPPSMDFYNNLESIDPFAMYIFEFSHVFSKQDLADMWQGLQPQVGRSHKLQSDDFEHRLLANHFYGVDNNLPNQLKWMVFKVKQRAKTNYYDKLVDAGQMESMFIEHGMKTQFEHILKDEVGTSVTYNWPYDYFSLVELINMKATVRFSNDDPETANIIPVTDPPDPPDPPEPAYEPVLDTPVVVEMEPIENEKEETHRSFKLYGGTEEPFGPLIPATYVYFDDGSVSYLPGDRRIEVPPRKLQYYAAGAAHRTIITYTDGSEKLLEGDHRLPRDIVSRILEYHGPGGSVLRTKITYADGSHTYVDGDQT